LDAVIKIQNPKIGKVIGIDLFIPPDSLKGGYNITVHRQGQKYESRFLLLANTAMMCTLTAHSQLEVRELTVRERTGHLPSYAEAKKMKSLYIPMAAALGLA